MVFAENFNKALHDADVGDAIGVSLTIAAGYLGVEGILSAKIPEIVVAIAVVFIAEWFGRSLKGRSAKLNNS